MASQTQIKLYGTYPLPRDALISATFQNTSGPAILANYAATNGEIAPSLGRNLAACGTSATCAATATVALIQPQTMFEGRKTQLNLRLSKRISLGPKLRLQANVDVYNVLNGSAVDNINTTYGPRWLQPTGNANLTGAIEEGRLVALGGQLTF